MNLENLLTSIKGVGSKTFEKFQKLNLKTIEDSLYYYPRTYVDRGNVKNISEFLNDDYGTIRATVESLSSRGRIGSNNGLFKIIVVDKTMKCEIIFFNSKFMVGKINPGDDFFFYGQMKFDGIRRTMMHPDYSPYSDAIGGDFFNIRPVYGLTKDLSQNEMIRIQKKIIKSIDSSMEETLPHEIIIENNLCDINFALKNIHFPRNLEAIEIARNRLVYEELFKLQMTLAIIKRKSVIENGFVIEESNVVDILDRLPFSLTNGQSSVLNEIFVDLKSKKSMNRLVQGDVGSGKTVVAMLAMIACARNNVQSVLMVPTEILAEQHYNFFKEYCFEYGVEILTGSSKNKPSIYERILCGDSKIIIGTHALIQEKIRYENLGLVITDEQHRFGVRQRNTLSEKGMNPNVLIMTATPIPRTLSLILYGDVDISIIKDMPKGRLDIKTHYIKKEKIRDMYEFIRENVKSGKQAFLICPLVEESEELDLKSIEKYYVEMVKKFPEFNVGFLFGKMKSSEKELVMRSFSENKINILVSTTVIEVGIDIPNSNIMVINDCERFGLAQLHQLRGRVGRGKDQSYCFFVSNRLTEVARKRINIMCKTNDGFEIADNDLSLRGPGEIIGIRQHGIPEFKIANLSRDLGVLEKVQKDVFQIIENLSEPEISTFVKKYLKHIFEGFTI